MDKWLQLVVVSSLMAGALCDFQCICNFQVELQVYPDTTGSSQPVGYLYEFDCKQELTLPGTDQKWFAVAYEHQKAYVQQGPQVQKQMCPGDPSPDDLVTTMKPVPTTTMMSTEAHATDTGTRSEAMTTTLPTTPTPSTTPTPPTTPAETTPIERTTPTPATTVEMTTPPPEPTTVMETDATTTTPTPPTAAPTTTTVPTTEVPKTETVKPTTMAQTTAVPTTTRVPTAATTTPPPTTTETTTMAIVTGSSPSPSPSTTIIKGNTNLCPGSVHQYTFSDNGFLTQYDDKCYELVPHLASWTHAEYICKNRNGHLVRIPDAAHQEFLYTFIQSHYTHRVWLGLHDREHEEQFQWVSGNPITYLNWMPGRKTLGHSTEDCVYMNTDGQWDDVKCGANNAILEPFQEKHAFMCQYDALSPAELATAGNTNLCPSNVKSDALRNDGNLGQHNQACYELLTHQKVTWAHAESMCKSRGGHLAYITSADEQTYIQNFMMANSPNHAVWIGLHDTQVEDHFQWTSGATVSYTNWVPGHRSNFESHHVEDCVAFIPYKNGVWDDIPCGQRFLFGGDGGETHPILCQYRTVSGSGAIG